MDLNLKPGQWKPIKFDKEEYLYDIFVGTNISLDKQHQFVKTCEFINTHCHDFLWDVQKSKKLLYHGQEHETNDFHIGYSKNNRKPKDTSKNIQLAVDKLLSYTNFKALRSNSIFCSPVRGKANNYGDVFIIFPVDGFNYTWSLMQNDWVISKYDLPKDFYELTHKIHDFITLILELSYDKPQKYKNIINSLEEELKLLTYTLQYNTPEFQTAIDTAFTFIKKYFKKSSGEYSTSSDKFKNIFDVEQLIHNILDLSKKADIKKISNEVIKRHKIMKTQLTTALQTRHEIWISGKYVAISETYLDAIKKYYSQYLGIKL